MPINLTRDMIDYSTDQGYIAYFSMEVGISHAIPTYSGGLGILAGDLLKSLADLGFPAIGISLINSKGYFKQEISSDQEQQEKPVDWNINSFMTLLPNTVTVNIAGRDVKVKTWRHIIRGSAGSNLCVYFLDTNLEDNSEYDRTLTSYLYGGDDDYRLCQEIILGIGGVRMIESLGYNIRKYHMNEGHSALLTLELLREAMDSKSGVEDPAGFVKERCVFTTHTPVAAGHDKFNIQKFKKMLGQDFFKVPHDSAVHEGMINMTFLALSHSNYINGVAKRHGEVAKEMFPNYVIEYITNGIHPQTWISPQFKDLFDKYIPGWIRDPFTLRYALSIPQEDILKAHQEAKRQLIEDVSNRTGIKLDQMRFTMGYARRFTAYKRPELIIHDIERLKRIAERVGDVQIIFSGKAHPKDKEGKEYIRQIIKAAIDINNSNCRIRIAFIPDYDMLIARRMVAGCDIWLNNPQRPLEASGTSGMKAALNGVPQVSTLDGWWLEGCIEGVTGWSIGPHPKDPLFKEDTDMSDEAEDLYVKLENIIIPTFYADRDKWADIMRHSIAINASFFNTYRMAQQYIANAYSGQLRLCKGVKK